MILFDQLSIDAFGCVSSNVNCVGDHIDFPATVINGTTVRCSPPAVVVGGPGALSVSVYGGATGTFSDPLAIVYYQLVNFAVGRRPYLSEATGNLLVTPAAELLGTTLTFTARLPCSGHGTGNASATRTWTWPPVHIANQTIMLPFSLAGLPGSINNDIGLTVDGVPGWSKGQLTKWRRLMRESAPAPPTVDPVQVDHHTAALLVNGRQFVGQGWYVYGGFAAALKNISLLFAPVRRHAALGVDMVMPYNLNDFNASDQLHYLDLCHAAGVKVLYPLADLGFTAGLNKQNYAKDWLNPAWVSAVRGNVTLVKSHPALLGYYLCDDCCPVDANLGNVTLQAQFFNFVKLLDPYHIISGAVQCHNLWQWSDVPANPTMAPSPAAAASQRAGTCAGAALGVQPPLQLSLDHILFENYGTPLVEHAGDGSPALGTSLDGSCRNGIPHTPLVNCRGLVNYTL